MIGDEMGEKVVAVGFRATEKLSLAALRKVIGRIGKLGNKILYHITTNKESMQELSKAGSQVQGIPVDKNEIKGFDRYARKYGLEYSLLRMKNDINKYVFCFKVKDFDKLEMVYHDLSKDGKEHGDLKEKIEQAREKAFTVNKAKKAEKKKEHVKSDRNRSVER